MSVNYYLGVDVGTGSVRAALVRQDGEIVRTATCPIKTWNPQTDFYEQSSDDIWRACCQVVKNVSQSVDRRSIKGIGFDATCSLVCIGEDNKPLTLSPTGKNEQNIILWMDHRAKSQAELINSYKPEVLRYVGGKISPEMETPKLMWVKKNLESTWGKAKYFFDLTDFLTWKATGDDARSLCTVVCKWTYVAGMNEASGSRVKIPGTKCGLGLTTDAAEELSLCPGTSVGAGLIDAHAGGLGLLTVVAPSINPSFDSKIGLICGTSTCHMVVNQYPKVITGVWGPYFSAMVPGWYLNEAGQSATGKLIDFVIDCHPASESIKKRLDDETHIHEYLNSRVHEIAGSRNLKSTATLTSKLHIWPDFHGNRSPLADPSLLGMMSGLSLVADEEDLAVKYLATMQALAYGTKHIVETLKSQGCKNLSTVLMCGGLSKNKLLAQIHADVLGWPVLVPKVQEPVLLGAAILGGVADGQWTDVQQALESIKNSSDVFRPSEIDRDYHTKKYRVFLKMVEDQKSYDAIMNERTSM